MSDVPTMVPAVGGSLFGEFGLLDYDVFTNQQCSPLEKNYSMLIEEETFQNRDDCVAKAETQSDADVVGVHMQDGVGDDKHPKTRKKRKQVPNLHDSPCHFRPERQRGKNWNKKEEDILVRLKGQGMEWTLISQVLTDNGFDRSSDHCNMKWYALRKHYKTIKDWMDQHPKVHYWGLPESGRIRSVPSYFSQSWYRIFDAAEGKKMVTSKLATGTSSHLGPTMGSVTLDSSQVPSCPVLVSTGPHEGSQLQSEGDWMCPGGGAVDAAAYPSTLSSSNIQMLVTEIRVLSNALRNKFETEERERIRNFQIKEQKLQLKLDRFNYKRKRDEDKRNREILDSMVLSTR